MSIGEGIPASDASSRVTVGQSLADVTGGQGEVMTRKDSGFATAIMGALLIGGLFKLVDMLSTPPMTDAQKQAAIAQETQQKAAYSQEQSRIQAAIAEKAKWEAPRR